MMAVRVEMSVYLCVCVCLCVCHAIGAEPDHSFSFAGFQTTVTRHQTVSRATAAGGTKESRALCVSMHVRSARNYVQNKVNNSVSCLLLHKVLREEVELLQMKQHLATLLLLRFKGYFYDKAFISKSMPQRKSAIQNAFIMHVL